jgi:hypothetical protein
VQLLYEALRAQALGEVSLQPLDTSGRDRWEEFGLLGLFAAEDVRGGSCEPTPWIRLQGATDSSAAWRGLVEAYRILIDRSLSDRFASRRSHGVASSSCRDLCEGVLSPPA